MLLVGKSVGKPKFGCPYCSSLTSFTSEGSLYTLKDLQNHHQV